MNTKKENFWLVEVLELYDRENYVADTFITRTPEKYKGSKYRIKKIKCK